MEDMDGFGDIFENMWCNLIFTTNVVYSEPSDQFLQIRAFGIINFVSSDFFQQNLRLLTLKIRDLFNISRLIDQRFYE